MSRMTAPALAEETPAAGDAEIVPADVAARRRARDRLLGEIPGSRLWGWGAPLLVTVIAGLLRFLRLDIPHKVIFDELYYAYDGYALTQFGVECDWEGEHPERVCEGAGYVVHPPLGKWMIAVGQLLFDGNPTIVSQSFGWRFSAAVVGTLSVLILARTARRMTRSTLLGATAGLLLALDGLHFVDSRTAVLDIFVMFWVLAAFACLVADRDWVRRRLAAHVTDDGDPPWPGPRLGPRWWLYGAGACAGAAIAVKWSAAFFLPAFMLLAWIWDNGARRLAGLRPPGRPWWPGLYFALPVIGSLVMLVRRAAGRTDGPTRMPRNGWAHRKLAFVVLPLAVYTVSWTGWFLSDGEHAYNHDRYVAEGQSTLEHAYAVGLGWLDYHRGAIRFHAHLGSEHSYESNPEEWPVLGRPVSYHWDTPATCGPGGRETSCASAILAIGTPALWWGSVIALLVCVGMWARSRDWRAGAVLLLFLASWLPWFLWRGDRTMFLFYLLPGVPFMVLAVVLVLGMLLGPPGAPGERRFWGAVVGGTFVLLVAANFAWFYPILAAQTVPYDVWHARIWFPFWL